MATASILEQDEVDELLRHWKEENQNLRVALSWRKIEDFSDSTRVYLVNQEVIRRIINHARFFEDHEIAPGHQCRTCAFIHLVNLLLVSVGEVLAPRPDRVTPYRLMTRSFSPANIREGETMVTEFSGPDFHFGWEEIVELKESPAPVENDLRLLDQDEIMRLVSDFQDSLKE